MTAVVSAGPTPVKEEGAATVPLQCMLCPKKPAFSDSSHLLTHISSKSHLHQKFSIEFRSKSDQEAKEQLEQYEAWYAEHRIERLMADRLSSKGTRKPTKRNRAPAKPTRKSTSAIDAMRAAHMASQLGGGVQTPENLPRMAHWNTAPTGTNAEYNTGFYHSPLSMRQRSIHPITDTGGGDGFVLKNSPFIPGFDGSNMSAPPSDIELSFGMGFTEDDAQSSRLKGVIWPGMDLFDSATPDQKKMRNQRKGTAIIDHLKLSSQSINAVETVWGPRGDMRKERDIYASPSDDGSPPSTPPRKRKHRARAAASSDSTPLSIMRCEDGQESQPTSKRIGRLNGIDLSSGRHTSSRTAGKNSKKHKKGDMDHDETDVEEPSYALAHAKPKGPFDVYYEGGNSSTINPQTGLSDVTRDNSLDPVTLNNRPALQQLDPNLSISEPSPYFKNSSSSRFYEHGTDPGHMSFRSQGSPYGTFPSIAGGPLNSMSSQPRSSTMYPPFDNQMFGGMNNADAPTPSFNGSTTRRMGFGSFGMDPNSSPFGYNDQREGSIRDSNFADPAYPGTSRLFEL